MEKISIALARLERIKELLSSWQQKKSISNIERNIALSQLATLYDQLIDLNMLESEVARVMPNKVEEPKQEKPPIVQPAPEVFVGKKEDEPVIVEQVILSAVENEKRETNTTTEQDSTVRLADKFVGSYKCLYENFEQQDNSGAARFSAIDDINRAIGINDRFLFIKELFNGDKDLFSRTISALNGHNCLDDALMYIHENFSWNSEDPTVKQLVLLLYRRFKQ